VREARGQAPALEALGQEHVREALGQALALEKANLDKTGVLHQGRSKHW